MTANEIAGDLNAADVRLGIVVSRFNDFLTDQLLKGAKDCFARLGGRAENLTVVRVPGSFEIPLVLKKLAEAGAVDTLVALGVVIQGETPHAGLITTQTAAAIMRLSLDTGVPVIDGIVAANNMDQALARCGTKAGNRGWSATQTAIEMANTCRALDGS